MAWKARLRNGLVQYSAERPPTRTQAVQELVGLDGGDWFLELSNSYPHRSADGGDFHTGALVLWPTPQLADGGDFSI